MSADTTKASGRFLLRLAPELHARLRAEARAAGVSLNEYCARRLAAPDAALPADVAQLVVRAAEVHGAALLGLVIFGSWARGEATDGSDVDVLIVLREGTGLDREGYRSWDETAPALGGRRAEVHLVRLPAAEGRVSGLWAEAAVDGLVAFERGLAVSRALAGIRRRIAEGRLIRRRAHGAPYWVEVA